MKGENVPRLHSVESPVQKIEHLKVQWQVQIMNMRRLIDTLERSIKLSECVFEPGYRAGPEMSDVMRQAKSLERNYLNTKDKKKSQGDSGAEESDVTKLVAKIEESLLDVGEVVLRLEGAIHLVQLSYEQVAPDTLVCP
jgi:hypothetical protein